MQWLAIGGGSGLVAESSAMITWTPTTFYVAAAVVHTVVIWFGYQLLGGDREYNNVPSAMAAATVGNVAAYFMRDFGVVGVAGTFGAWFLLLIITSGIDLFRSFVVFILVMLSYWGLGTFIAQRTPLDAYTIGGVPKMEMTGGFQEEPIESSERDDANDSLPGN
jgi:hypothetical protein